MKTKTLTIIISTVALLLCLICLASCKNNEIPTNDSVSGTYASSQIETKEIFVNKAQPLEYGFITCYSNPQHEENIENEDNSYGIMDSEGNVVIEPKYDNAFPASRETFIISDVKEGETYSSMIDSDGKTIISSFKGKIVPIYYKNNATIAIIEPKEEKSYLVNMTGEKLLGLDFNSIYIAKETRQNILEAYSEGIAYYISLDGKLIAELPANKPVLDPFKEGKGGTVITCCYLPEKCDGCILYGLYDSSDGHEIVPCSRKNGFAINEERFILKDTSALGPDYEDFASIYDENGNVICADGEYQDIIFDNGSSWGIGVTINPTEDHTSSIVKYYKIDADGNKLSEALDSMPEVNK